MGVVRDLWLAGIADVVMKSVVLGRGMLVSTGWSQFFIPAVNPVCMSALSMFGQGLISECVWRCCLLNNRGF